ncbi:MAG: hypothetical protein M1530_00820, partial [Candidatus Marsarchaeota archaeon]|nr:hypothetical protein [Candidatus Marsarchaeota archaeon]
WCDVSSYVFLFFSSSGERISALEQAQARALGQSLSDRAGEVWYMGNGSRSMMLVNFPNGLRNISLAGDRVDDTHLMSSGHEITISYLAPPAGQRDIVINSPAPVRSVPPDFGSNGRALSSSDKAQALLAQPSAGPGSTLRSGLVAVIFVNNGTYVNILRQVYGKVE